jgi:hypothetical protein
MVYNIMVENKENRTTLEQLNGLSEIADFMQDDELTEALAMVAKLILKPDIPLNVATLYIVRLQAIAAKMAFRATWMVNVEKGNREKKNIYFTAHEALTDLVSALKYIVK